MINNFRILSLVSEKETAPQELKAAIIQKLQLLALVVRFPFIQ